MRDAPLEPSSTSTGDAAASASIDSFLAEVARISMASGRPLLPALAPGDVIAARYRLTKPLGRGAHGVVWEADDEVGRTRVAVKVGLATSTEHAARVRAEVAALRLLKITGVVRLLDEGLEGSSPFLVMPLIHGSPFPGRRTMTWDELASVTELLLTTLEQVHSAGIVHRDLKPANVLVTSDGRPTILDFGLSLASRLDALDEQHRVLGTPAYLAPEQIGDGEIDGRADLYAVGVMLFQAASSRFPYQASTVPGLLVAKRAPAPSLATFAPDLPDHAIRLVDALLSVEPSRRPASAREAVVELRDKRSSRRLESRWLASPLHDREAACTAEELEALFSGNDRLSWVRRDAARVLHASSRGAPAAVRETIERWTAQRRCRWDDANAGRVVIDREALDAMEARLLPRATSLGEAFVEEALALATSLAEEGRLGHAMAAIHEATAALRRAPSLDERSLVRALSLWIAIALRLGEQQSLDRVLYEVCRTEARSKQLEQLERLVRAALAANAWTERASNLSEAVEPFDDPILERRRLEVRVSAARRSSLAREEQVVDDIVRAAAQSSDAELRGCALGWLGRLRYRQGRYAEATVLHRQAADAARWRTERLAAMLNAASAALEAFDEESTLSLATAARDEARECRHPYLAARAEWLVRSAQYRLGPEHAVDNELLDAARALAAPDMFGLLCLVEAAQAYRCGDPRAPDLAAEAHTCWSSAGESIASLVAGSLACACAAPLDPSVRQKLLESAWRCTVPGVGIQCAALLHLGGERAASEATVARLQATIPEEHWSRRMAILSVDEARAALLPRHVGL